MTRGSSFVFPHIGQNSSSHHGLTKREYIAMFAMQGILAGGSVNIENPMTIAASAVECADALIQALDQKSKDDDASSVAETISFLKGIAQ